METSARQQMATHILHNFTGKQADGYCNSVVYRRELTPGTPSDKVLLFSGGGTGHEPAHVGFVGTGMLDVAVAGSIFASPSAAQVLAALSSITSTKGLVRLASQGLAAIRTKSNGI